MWFFFFLDFCESMNFTFRLYEGLRSFKLLLISLLFSNFLLFMWHLCAAGEKTSRAVNWCMFALSQWAAELLTESRRCTCPFSVILSSFRWHKLFMNLPVTSVFDILHVVSFNHSGLCWLLAWLRAAQTSAQHWTFLHWLNNLHVFKICNSLSICLVWWCCGRCSCYRVVCLKHLFGTDCGRSTTWIHWIRGGISTDAFPAKSGTSLI